MANLLDKKGSALGVGPSFPERVSGRINLAVRIKRLTLRLVHFVVSDNVLRNPESPSCTLLMRLASYVHLLILHSSASRV